MKESEIYISLASRFIAASTAANAHAHEAAGFACYHAFESAGGAFVTHHGYHYPRTHNAKLNEFARRSKGRTFNRAIAMLNIELAAARNLFLYPNANGMGWDHPKDLISPNDVQKLRSRVNGIVKIVETEVT